MSKAKSLTEEQVTTIRSWAEEGDGLPAIQQKLAGEMGVKVTYLETRFLLEDLKIELKPEPVPEPEAEDEEPESDVIDTDESVGTDGVSVTLDTLQRPGAIVSGKARFSGGKSATWWLDQMGRLGFEPDQEGFTPSEDEAIAFQKELQAAIRKRGF